MSYLGKKITKPKSTAWNYFKEVKEPDDKSKDANASVVKYQCIYCAARYAGHATRLTKHLSRGCPKCPRSVVIEIRNLLKHRMIERRARNKADGFCDSLANTNESDDTSDVERITIPHPSARNTTESFDATSNIVDSKYQRISESSYARAFYSGGLSWNFNENEYWREFLNYLNPQFKVPSTLKLTQSLLERETCFIENHVHRLIEESPVLCLQCLLTSDKRGNSMLSFVVNVPKPLFLKSVTASRKDEISRLVEDETTCAMKNFGFYKFVGVLTNDVSVLRILNSQSFDLTSYSCVSVSLDLFLNEILGLETARCVWAKVQFVVSELGEKVSELSSAFTSSSSPSPAPSKNDWSSTRRCFNVVLTHKTTIKSCGALEQSHISPQVRDVIGSDEFWSSVEKLYVVVEPIFEYLNDFCDKKVGIGAVVNAFREYAIHLESVAGNIFRRSEVETMRELLSYRESVTVAPVHLSAHILDPMSNGSRLSDEEQILGSEFIDKMSGMMFKGDTEAVKQVLCELAKYRCQEGIFAAAYVRKTAADLSPAIWWKGSCYGLKLSKVASFILSLPASTSLLDDVLRFEVPDFERNSLSSQQASLYTFAFNNLNLMQPSICSTAFEKNLDDYEELADEENLISEEDISEIEYEISLSDCEKND